MRAPLAVLLCAASLFLVGCAATSSTTTPAAPLPDARDLAENPLDVINLPQP
jgi:type IV pilus biogenesis protein CpaD/CtpE